MEQNLALQLSTTEINTILMALGKLPYDNVAQLIPKIVSQANQQLVPPADPAAGEQKGANNDE